MNTSLLLSMPNEIFSAMFKELSLNDHINTNLTCAKLNKFTNLFFKENDKQFELIKILVKAQKIFTPLGTSFQDIKSQMTANAIFKKDCFDQFIFDLNKKLVNHLFLYSMKKLDDTEMQKMNNFFGPKACETTFHKDEKVFSILENGGFSSLLGKCFIEEYHKTNDTSVFNNGCRFCANFKAKHLVPTLEVMFETLFVGFKHSCLLSIKEEALHDPAFKAGLMLGLQEVGGLTYSYYLTQVYRDDFDLDTDLTGIGNGDIYCCFLEKDEFRELSFLDCVLTKIGACEIEDWCLSKPHITLQNRIRRECLPALKASLEKLT